MVHGNTSASRGGPPRVGIMRGVVPSVRPHTTDVRHNLPLEVLDPIALQSIRDEAEQEGHRAGYEAGLAAARAEADQIRAQAEQRYAAVLAALEDAAAQLHTRQVRALDHVADQTALLALRIAEIVLQREVSTSVDPGMDAIARAMGLVPEDGTVRVRLNPADLATLGDVDGVLPGRQVELIGDPAISSGGCVIAVGATRIDAQIPAALGRVAEVLR